MFHQKLITYINRGIFSKLDIVLEIIHPNYLFQKNAKILISSAQQNAIQEQSEKKAQTVELNFYKGNNTSVLKMISQLKKELKDDMYGAYLHGSLATLEEVGYSDFDALVIIKDDVLEDEKRLASVALKLNRLQHIMHEYDPLQHHGWFVLAEGMLQNYPSAYFPPVLFNYSKSLFENQGLSLKLEIANNTTDYRSPFFNLANALIAKLNHFELTTNSFALKSVLSEFMLLPSLYIQAKNGKGIFKKNSFEIASKDFNKEDWTIMNEVSKIRNEWGYKINPVQKYLLSNKSYSIRKLARKFAPPIHSSISNKLDRVFYAKMLKLVVLSKEKLGKSLDS